MGTGGNEKTAWRLPGRTDAYHAFSDASLFSSSLSVLSHEKRKYSLISIFLYFTMDS